ncbi:Alpha/Beta hydrolase protein [Stachybotrys elegans]|uniref:Alpha/Beta hydrolase protein n=1 Tax=Stachybotrys elegans TaxID=80388 RepID=A0A8K0SRY8_9HYPO|nr:Alpha/Beta hydrolase protein [Stachybotrys elegans]
MAMKTVVLAAALSTVARLTAAQFPPAAVHITSFNSSFILTPAQIEAGQLDNDQVETIQNIVRFDQSQCAFGGPLEDEFYTLPPLTNGTALEPGLVLKVQAFTDPTAYALPPNTALSRIMYTSLNFNGTVVPATGFILWPFTPRKTHTAGSRNSTPPDKLSTIVWAHGTSGFFAPQAPSAHRSLWYGYSAPFALAQAGYAVFAPDFAGLGVGKSWDGTEIPHQYHANLAAARDSLYGFEAAVKSFPERLVGNFVAMGHSQGGATAWAIAEAMVSDEFAHLQQSYKGSIPASPTTNFLASPPTEFMLATSGLMLHSIFPTFTLEDWLTPIGAARLRLYREIQGGISVLIQLILTRTDIVRENWDRTWYAAAFSKLDVGGNDFRGPLLVLQGSDDSRVLYNLTLAAVAETSVLFPDRDLEFMVASGVGHNPVLEATQHLWMQWIHDRFDGRPLAKAGSFRTDVESFLPIQQYQSTGNSFPLWAGLPEYSYEVPLSV